MPSGKLLDASNSAAPTLTAHKHAIEAKRADEAAKQQERQLETLQALQPSSSMISLPESQPDTATLASTPSFPSITSTPENDADAGELDSESEQPCRCFITQRHRSTD